MVRTLRHSKRWLFVLLGIALFGALLSGVASAGTVALEASLAASNEVPPNSSGGSGTLVASFNTDTKVLNYSLSYSGLTGVAKAAHFHGPAAMGSNAGVVLPFVAALDSPVAGTAVLTEAQATDLLDGKWYVNVHTAANPGGEIRGQVKPK